MSVVTTAGLVRAAIERGSAVAAFNTITLEHAEAVIGGAESAARPVILQISENAVRFHGGQLRPIARAAIEAAQLSPVEIALHLDHVTDPALLRQAAEAGFSSAMFDAGAARYDANVAATRQAADLAREAGIWLEAELGYVGGKPDAPASAHAAGVRTDPVEAAAFVSATGVDALAVAVGSSHAMTSRTASLDHGLIADIAVAVSVPLVLHGSSGVADDELRAAVAAGMRKINVGTALNIAFTAAVREQLGTDATVVDPRKYLAVARAALSTTVAGLLRVISD
jgi:fructose-bisphosphate aldolase class II